MQYPLVALIEQEEGKFEHIKGMDEQGVTNWLLNNIWYNSNYKQWQYLQLLRKIKQKISELDNELEHCLNEFEQAIVAEQSTEVCVANLDDKFVEYAEEYRTAVREFYSASSTILPKSIWQRKTYKLLDTSCDKISKMAPMFFHATIERIIRSRIDDLEQATIKPEKIENRLIGYQHVISNLIPNAAIPIITSVPESGVLFSNLTALKDRIAGIFNTLLKTTSEWSEPKTASQTILVQEVQAKPESIETIQLQKTIEELQKEKAELSIRNQQLLEQNKQLAQNRNALTKPSGLSATLRKVNKQLSKLNYESLLALEADSELAQTLEKIAKLSVAELGECPSEKKLLTVSIAPLLAAHVPACKISEQTRTPTTSQSSSTGTSHLLAELSKTLQQRNSQALQNPPSLQQVEKAANPHMLNLIKITLKLHGIEPKLDKNFKNHCDIANSNKLKKLEVTNIEDEACLLFFKIEKLVRLLEVSQQKPSMISELGSTNSDLQVSHSYTP